MVVPALEIVCISLLGSASASSTLSAASSASVDGRLTFRNDEERGRAVKAGITDFDKVYTRDEMVTRDVIFACTGVTDGNILPGIRREIGYLTAETVLMRSKTGSVRHMTYRNPTS